MSERNIFECRHGYLELEGNFCPRCDRERIVKLEAQMAAVDTYIRESEENRADALEVERFEWMWRHCRFVDKLLLLAAGLVAVSVICLLLYHFWAAKA